jgi:hypothetical protein
MQTRYRQLESLNRQRLALYILFKSSKISREDYLDSIYPLDKKIDSFEFKFINPNSCVLGKLLSK